MQVVAQANAEEAARLREALADAVLARDEAHRQAESARQDLQRHSRAAAAQPAAAGASGSGGGANGVRRARELQELQVRFNERSAELGLLQVRGLYSYLLSTLICTPWHLRQTEKAQLQRSVADLKAGKMNAVYEQARQDAEKEVLDRMVASGFHFDGGAV